MARADPVPAPPNLLSLVDNPRLPALVEKLPLPVLSRLIGAVGVEDAGSLVAMTTPRQMRELFDDVLWQTPAPGLPARFSVGEFLRWLEVLNEESVAFTVERLQTLGEQFLTAALGRILDVHGKDAQFGGQVLSDDREDFGDFLARTLPAYDDHWDTIRTTLAALKDENPRFLDRVLRCCTPSWAGFASERPYVLAQVDESGDREMRREQAGFVGTDTASAFLAEARATPAATLIEADGYDPISARYLALRPADDGEGGEPPEGQTGTSPNEALDEELMGLLVVLGQIEGIGQAPRLLAPDGPRTLTIKARLAALEHDQPGAFAVRMGELVFLANVLMSGISSPRLTETEAPNVALAICNLGAGRDGGAVNVLSNPPGLVGLFRVGWHMLSPTAPAGSTTVGRGTARPGHPRTPWRAPMDPRRARPRDRRSRESRRPRQVRRHRGVPRHRFAGDRSRSRPMVERSRLGVTENAHHGGRHGEARDPDPAYSRRRGSCAGRAFPCAVARTRQAVRTVPWSGVGAGVASSGLGLHHACSRSR